MRKFMQQSNDHALAAFDNRNDASFVSAYVDRVQAEADARRSKKRRNQQPRAKRKQNAKLFQLKLPRDANPGSNFVVTIDHQLPAELKEQDFHVTLKDVAGKRLERKIVSASGNGKISVAFKLPAGLDSKSVSISAFVGKDYTNNLLHLTEGPVVVSK